MKRIGLTGNIGTGKSTIARIFEILGVQVYHADMQARQMLESYKIIDQIEFLFGKHVLSPEHKIDRNALAAIVFTDKEKLAALNSIIHPAIKEDFENWCLLQAKSVYILHEAAILFESGFDRLFDANILVTAPDELCIARVMARDSVTKEMVADRIRNQWPQKKKLELADYILVNDEISMAIPQVLALHREILNT